MSLKKHSVIVIGMLFLILSLGGCKNKAESSEVDKNQKDTKATMGRYMENVVSLPEELKSDTIQCITKGREDNLEIYTLEEELYYCYTQKDDGSFDKVEQPWLSMNKEESRDKIQVLYGEDKNLYAYYDTYGENSVQSFFIKASDDKSTAQEIKIAYLQKRVNDESDDFVLYPRIETAGVLKNGNIVIGESFTEGARIIDAATGEDISVLAAAQSNEKGSYYNATYGVPFTVKDNCIIIVNTTGDKVVVYDAEKESTIRELEVDVKSIMMYDVDAEGTIYVCGRSGINKMAEGGTLWENVLDGTLCSLNTPSVSFTKFMQVKQENNKPVFYCLAADSLGGSIYRYAYDPSVASVPSKELTIYSLQANATIRQAISSYQKNNPDVRVIYQIAMEENGSTPAEDYIKVLNTEILAGKGADILVLDGLPRASYMEKGVLADISDVILPKIDSNTLSKDMLKSYIKDNKVYSVPTRFQTPYAFGEKEAVEAAHSLSSLLTYTQNAEGKSVIHPISTKELTGIILTYYYPEVIKEDKTIDEAALTQVLKIVREITKDLGEEQNGFNNINSNQLLSFYGSWSCTGLETKKEKLGLDRVGFVDDMMIPFSVIDRNQYSYSTIGKNYFPMGTVGINSASKNQELAKDFISYLFSDELQAIKVYDGFPLNQEVLKKWFEEQNDNVSAGITAEDGTEVSGTWPKKEYRDGMYQMALKLDTPIEVDSVIVNQIMTEAEKYYKENASIEDTIHAIESSISTYLIE